MADKAFTDGACLGPFHGIPFALKDIYELKDQITTCGSYEMRQRISSETGTVVKRLLEAGGIAIGKTKTVECALGGWGTNEQMGTPWNPGILTPKSSRRIFLRLWRCGCEWISQLCNWKRHRRICPVACRLLWLNWFKS